MAIRIFLMSLTLYQASKLSAISYRLQQELMAYSVWLVARNQIGR
jgi:hypothetical protein